MYSIKLKTHVNLTPARLIRLWRKPNLLLKSAKNIRKLTVIKREKDKLFTSWEVEIDKVLLRWREIDKLDSKNGKIHFKMQDGEFKKYEGTWHVTPGNDGTSLLYLNVDIDWGIPRLEPYVKDVLEKKSRRIFKSLIDSIKRVSESHEK